jgi:hypothetical protein
MLGCAHSWRDVRQPLDDVHSRAVGWEYRGRAMEPRKLQPGDSREHPLPAVQPKELTQGRRYEGWPCNTCGKRVEILEAVSDTPVPGDRIQGHWVTCAYCKTTDLYRWDRRTTEEYREDGGVVT